MMAICLRGDQTIMANWASGKDICEEKNVVSSHLLYCSDTNARPTPTLVRAAQGTHFEQVSAGCRVSMARTKQGHVWLWGATISS